MWSMTVGGAERAVFQLIKAQRACGLNADLLVAHEVGYYAQSAEACGARVWNLNKAHPLDFRSNSQVSDLLNNYDIIHFHTAEIGVLKIACKKIHLKRFYTHRGGLREYSLKKKFIYEIVGHYLRRYFHGLAANTDQAKRAAAQLYRIPIEKIKTIYNGIDFSLLRPQTKRENILGLLPPCKNGTAYVGTCANLRPWKRVDLLLEAMSSLGDYSVQCLVIGDGPSKPELERKAEELGIATQTHFLGKIEGVADYLQIMDVFVLPSGPEESFGNAAVEAMGFGIPTIVFADGGGLLEHVENNKTGFIVNSTAQLTTQLRELIKDSKLRKSIGRRAQMEVSQKYSFENMVKNHIAFYEQSFA